MAHFIKRDFVKGTKVDFDEIKSIFENDQELLKSWADNCGIEIYDDRCVYGWPDLFEKFYEGYHSRKINIIYLVTRRISWGYVEEVDVLCFFTEYRKAIEYVNSFPDEFNISYDIDEVEEK